MLAERVGPEGVGVFGVAHRYVAAHTFGEAVAGENSKTCCLCVVVFLVEKLIYMLFVTWRAEIISLPCGRGSMRVLCRTRRREGCLGDRHPERWLVAVFSPCLDRHLIGGRVALFAEQV